MILQMIKVYKGVLTQIGLSQDGIVGDFVVLFIVVGDKNMQGL